MASIPQASITQPLVQGMTQPITQSTSSHVPSQPLTTSLATQLGTNLGLTPNLGNNIILVTQDTTIPQNTNWTPTFHAQPYASTTTSSQSIPIVLKIQVSQTPQVEQGQVNTIIQGQPLTQQGQTSNHPIDTSNQLVPQATQTNQRNTSNPLVTNPIDQGNSLVSNQTHKGNASNTLVRQHQFNQGNSSNQLIQSQIMPLTSQHQVAPSQPLVPQIIQN